MAAATSSNFRLMVLLFACGMVLMASATSAKACPLYCLGGVDYATCPSSGTEKLRAGCNCCLSRLGHGCTMHFNDGSTMLC
ncbi:hypothetical protein Droror1_Dr00014963 [Drosera rotundifolia]